VTTLTATDRSGKDHEIKFRSDITVELMSVPAAASDASVIAAARVSTQGADSAQFWEMDPAESMGLIKFLARNRHGTPFEHNQFIFRVSAPIFVYREWHRHRVGWSYNEESGRYSVLEAAFYLPGTDRKLIEKPGSKPGNYEYVPGTSAQYDWLVEDMMEDCANLYTRYQDRLWRGYAKEVARMTLPVNVYSAMYATCNARSLMSFLSLRTERSDAAYPSKPMREIAMASEEMERIFAETMPITWAAFEEFGRVGP
jgi:thymidylate synthase (FAD)